MTSPMTTTTRPTSSATGSPDGEPAASSATAPPTTYYTMAQNPVPDAHTFTGDSKRAKSEDTGNNPVSGAASSIVVHTDLWTCSLQWY